MNTKAYESYTPEKGRIARVRSLNSSVDLDLSIAKAAINEGNSYNAIKHIERAERTLEKIRGLN